MTARRRESCGLREGGFLLTVADVRASFASWIVPAMIALAAPGVGSCSRVATPTAAKRTDAPRVTHGVAVGQVGTEDAVAWARCSEAGLLQLTVRHATGHGGAAAPTSVVTTVGPDDDLVGKRRLTGLSPATEYVVHARCSPPDGVTRDDPAEQLDEGQATARFRTAPRRDDPVPIRFAWSGDLGGQNVCRDRDQGYAIFDRIRAQRPDFFIGLGDMIYADNPCLAIGRYGNPQIEGPEQRGDLTSYRAVWSYNRADPAFLRLLAGTPYEAVWDDHEVLNDFGPHHDTASKPPLPPDIHLLPIGREAFLDWNPLLADGADDRLYRSARWGRHLEVFFLDTRSHRDANAAADSASAPKSLLGATQRQWLEERVASSDATWKVFVTSVPLSLPTGQPNARDSFASSESRLGFERELTSLLRGLQRAGVTTPVFITTDVHFQYVARHTPFPDDPRFHVYEIAVGPLTAGLISPIAPDPTLHPQVLYSNGPKDLKSLDWPAAQRWFNFGVIDVDAGGRFRLEIFDGTGATVYEIALERPSG